MSEGSEPFDKFVAPVLPAQSTAIPVPSAKSERTLKAKTESSKSKESVSLPYKEPAWSGIPPPSFSFEIIKNGTVVTNLPLRSSYIVFGRLSDCDVVFEHPSVSRYHAILQYCKGDDTHDKGFYLYDLGSTHGTFLNKEQMKAKIYYKLKVGYVIKFGGSSRLHIFQGPEEVVVVEEQKNEKIEEACAWGMGEDAEEDEELSEINPFALSVTNEELYIDDPKKTLRGWFEREGYELEYKCEEKGFQTFSCTIRLPVDTSTGEYMPVEASVKGKKKEAVIACALEACRTLDRMGLLRQAQHESKQKKRKNWEENDYYDSDEDTFYDRSGEIEKRREMRKRLANKKSETENFQSLESKLKILTDEIESINSKLTSYTAKASQEAASGEGDSLESYMSGLEKANDAPKDKFEKRRLMLRLVDAGKEKARIEKMLNIARPAKLPPVVKHLGMIGKRFKSKLNLPIAKPKKPVLDDTEELEEEEEKDIEAVPLDNKLQNLTDDEKKRDSQSELSPKTFGLILPKKGELISYDCEKPAKEEAKTDSRSETTQKTFGLILPQKDQPISSFEKPKPADDDSVHASSDDPLKQDVSDADVDQHNTQTDTTVVTLQPTLSKHHKKSRSKKPKTEVDVYKTQNDDYCTWTPPSNQSGDGMTHLNNKYGY